MLSQVVGKGGEKKETAFSCVFSWFLYTCFLIIRKLVNVALSGFPVSFFGGRPAIYAIFNDLITEVLHLELKKNKQTLRNSGNLINKNFCSSSTQFFPS